jgi:hypothetical protein
VCLGIYVRLKLTSSLQRIPEQIQRAKAEAKPHLDHHLGPPSSDPATTGDDDVCEELVQACRDEGRRNDDQGARGDVGGGIGRVFAETGGTERVA